MAGIRESKQDLMLTRPPSKESSSSWTVSQVSGYILSNTTHCTVLSKPTSQRVKQCQRCCHLSFRDQTLCVEYNLQCLQMSSCDVAFLMAFLVCPRVVFLAASTWVVLSSVLSLRRDDREGAWSHFPRCEGSLQFGRGSKS